ncbi:hypothetical protein HN587_06965 [Candidatus Woesearchaeota archaeon]|jgi:hypothetical protein|nr:hypothetical protein [Candidatus Woesearchaeota archaeon]
MAKKRKPKNTARTFEYNPTELDDLVSLTDVMLGHVTPQDSPLDVTHVGFDYSPAHVSEDLEPIVLQTPPAIDRTYQPVDVVGEDIVIEKPAPAQAVVPAEEVSNPQNWGGDVEQQWLSTPSEKPVKEITPDPALEVPVAAMVEPKYDQPAPIVKEPVQVVEEPVPVVEEPAPIIFDEPVQVEAVAIEPQIVNETPAEKKPWFGRRAYNAWQARRNPELIDDETVELPDSVEPDLAGIVQDWTTAKPTTEGVEIVDPVDSDKALIDGWMGRENDPAHIRALAENPELVVREMDEGVYNPANHADLTPVQLQDPKKEVTPKPKESRWHRYWRQKRELKAELAEGTDQDKSNRPSLRQRWANVRSTFGQGKRLDAELAELAAPEEVVVPKELSPIPDAEVNPVVDVALHTRVTQEIPVVKIPPENAVDSEVKQDKPKKTVLEKLVVEQVTPVTIAVDTTDKTRLWFLDQTLRKYEARRVEELKTLEGQTDAVKNSTTLRYKIEILSAILESKPDQHPLSDSPRPSYFTNTGDIAEEMQILDKGINHERFRRATYQVFMYAVNDIEKTYELEKPKVNIPEFKLKTPTDMTHKDTLQTKLLTYMGRMQNHWSDDSYRKPTDRFTSELFYRIELLTELLNDHEIDLAKTGQRLIDETHCFNKKNYDSASRLIMLYATTKPSEWSKFVK